MESFLTLLTSLTFRQFKEDYYSNHTPLYPILIRMIPGLFDNYSFLIFLSLAGCALFVYGYYLLVKKFKRTIEVKFSWWKSLITFVVIVLLSIIGIRGGLQLKPIRQTNAFFSDNMALGYLTLNSTYTVMRSYFQYTFSTYNFMPEDKAGRVIESMIKSDDEEMLNQKYPFLRITNPGSTMIKKNVVLFILESWSANVIGSISGEKTYTPNFFSLAKDGMLFTNFLASGQRSITSVTSILTSIPSIFQGSIIGSRVEINKMRGLGSIFLEQGYTTSFHYGAAYGSMGFDGFVPRVGFSHYFSKNDFENYADSLDDGVWGVFDEPYFLDAGKKYRNLMTHSAQLFFH
ncbi:MAG: sulfatase-like hydrolase/transferase [Melioribacteraceae bacterium]|nr:sulfatase-like hydrolase/transferase [Melioribacteraceae bacterium]